MFGSTEVRVMDAQQQRRTPRTVKGPWVRPRVPSKALGRKGTRRSWKRKNPPRHIMLYEEPTDCLMVEARAGLLGNPAYVIVTPRQYDALKKAVPERKPPGNDFSRNPWR